MSSQEGKISRRCVSGNPMPNGNRNDCGLFRNIRALFQKSSSIAPQTPNSPPQNIALLHLLRATRRDDVQSYLELTSNDLIEKLGLPKNKNFLGMKKSVEFSKILNLLNNYHEIKSNTAHESRQQLSTILIKLIKSCTQYQKVKNRRPDDEKMIDRVLDQAENTLFAIQMQELTQTHPSNRIEESDRADDSIALSSSQSPPADVQDQNDDSLDSARNQVYNFIMENYGYQQNRDFFEDQEIHTDEDQEIHTDEDQEIHTDEDRGIHTDEKHDIHTEPRIPTGIRSSKEDLNQKAEDVFYPAHGMGLGIVGSKLSGVHLGGIAGKKIDANYAYDKTGNIPGTVQSGLSTIGTAFRINKTRKMLKFWKNELKVLTRNASSELSTYDKNGNKNLLPEKKLKQIAYSEETNARLANEAKRMLLTLNRIFQYGNTRKNQAADCGMNLAGFASNIAVTAGSFAASIPAQVAGFLAGSCLPLNPKSEYLNQLAVGRTYKGSRIEFLTAQNLVKSGVPITAENMMKAEEEAEETINGSKEKMCCCLPINTYNSSISFQKKNTNWLNLSQFVYQQMVNTLKQDANNYPNQFAGMLLDYKNEIFSSVEMCAEYFYALGGQTIEEGREFAQVLLAKLALEEEALKQGMSKEELAAIATKNDLQGGRDSLGYAIDVIWATVLTRH